MNSKRTYDIIVYGATGFTGKQAAQYLCEHATDLKWTIAGRNASKLDSVARELGIQTSPIVADSQRLDALGAMAQQTRVLLTTAGPYAKFGDGVVQACVEAGTDYVDITGETPWVRRMIDRWHDKAAADGTKIVPFCGFDSVPSDLGAFMVSRFVREQWHQDTASVRGAFKMGGGGYNGGTLASALSMAEAGEGRALADVLHLNPPEARSKEERRRSADWREVSYDEDLGAWLAPFVMGQVNTRVVRRSNALYAAAGQGYGQEFTYRECSEGRRRFLAWRNTAALLALSRLLQYAAGRRLLQRVGPEPGAGPSEAQMDAGWFRTRHLGQAADGRKVLATIKSQGDAGNRSTVRMLCESALCLARQRDELPDHAGVITPATAFGQVLIDRLVNTGKMTWDVSPLV